MVGANFAPPGTVRSPMSDLLQHECGIALLRLKKAAPVLHRHLRDGLLRPEQDVPPDGEAAEPRARRRGPGQRQDSTCPRATATSAGPAPRPSNRSRTSSRRSWAASPTRGSTIRSASRMPIGSNSPSNHAFTGEVFLGPPPLRHLRPQHHRARPPLSPAEQLAQPDPRPRRQLQPDQRRRAVRQAWWIWASTPRRRPTRSPSSRRSATSSTRRSKRPSASSRMPATKTRKSAGSSQTTSTWPTSCAVPRSTGTAAT